MLDLKLVEQLITLDIVLLHWSNNSTGKISNDRKGSVFNYKNNKKSKYCLQINVLKGEYLLNIFP